MGVLKTDVLVLLSCSDYVRCLATCLNASDVTGVKEGYK